ncbi:hypothetical protein PTI98_005663 [Pleurotus ostreatus]|nr:hypothetical protein PTI98_005663 [Pleurotus ostreatus]
MNDGMQESKVFQRVSLFTVHSPASSSSMTAKSTDLWRFKGFQRLTGTTSLSPEDPPLWSAREIELIRAYLTEYSMQEEKYRMSFTRKKLISSANGRQLWGRLIQQISDKIGLPALISQSMEEGGVNPFMVQSQTGTWPQAKQCVSRFSDYVGQKLLG